jgi:hypothetical protein
VGENGIKMDYTTLITDRTLEDVQKWLELRHKAYADMEEEERTLWNKSLKGTYNISDLNRVGEAVKDLTERLYISGYVVKTSPKIDWVLPDIPTLEQLYTYVNNIKILREALQLQEDTPECPTEMNKLMYNEANAIEQILFNLDFAIKQLIKNYIYCGEQYGTSEFDIIQCGEI